MNQATRTQNGSTEAGTLHMALELSRKTWKLAFSDGTARPARVVSVPGRELGEVREQIARAKQRFELPAEAVVRSCYEAGRDGFWVHRALGTLGVENLVVDPASIEVNRRRRRAKTDRLDALKLVTQLVRHHRGERVWSVVRVPEVEDEDARHLHRELQVLKAQRRNHRMRIQSLLFTQGIDLRVGRGFLEQLPKLQRWDGAELSEMLRARLVREHHRLQQVEEQIRELEATRQALLESARTKSIQRAQLLAQLCGIGISSSWVFVMEFFGWRRFRNRREVAAAAGLTPTPFSSGDSPWEQGISKAGNPRVWALMIEIAWSWLRYQPESELSRWFCRRFAHGSGRMRRVGIVAMARRLLVDLWRFVELGVVPDGARIKTVP